MKIQLCGRRYLHLTTLQAFTNELKQKQAIIDSLINKILYSKRLLVDHVEALEQCLRHMGAQQNVTCSAVDAENKNTVEILTARNACLLLGTTILEHLITPKSLRLTLLPSLLLSSSFCTMYLVKNVFVFRNKIVERELDQLIHTIDEFGNCIRRNITYFNEIIIMKQNELIESRQIERAWDCITAAKEVTEILYDATRKLENTYELPISFTSYYAPMEELRECEYFKTNVTDYNPKHIKDFHNIFAYVQSQFLLRFALTLLTQPSLSELNVELVKLDWLVRQLVQEEENHFNNLSIEQQNRRQLVEVDGAFNTTKTMQNRKGPVAVLQDSSLKLSARMVAVAGECQALDITLQRLTQAENAKRNNAKQLVEVANNMRSIENALSICFDDFQRLSLVYNKFLNSKLNENNVEEHKNKMTTMDDEFGESILRVEISQHSNECGPKDDFYAYMFDAKNEPICNNTQTKNAENELEILNFEKRLTKGKFRPVLKQLKERINPIREVLLQKEREILAAKGINVDKLFGKTDAIKTKERPSLKVCFNNGTAVCDKDCNELAPAVEDVDSEGSEGSADLEFQRRTKQLKERDNFAEMRNFLVQKQAINLFSVHPTEEHAGGSVGNEEILESEC